MPELPRKLVATGFMPPVRYNCVVLLLRVVIFVIATGVIGFGQAQPDLARQREAMKKLSFLVGTWNGDAQVYRGPGEPIKIRQTEQVQYKLDGLVLMIEGTGRRPDNNKVVFNALATVAYDEDSKTYRFRSYNDGRYLDTEMTVMEGGFGWGYTAGPAVMRFVMKLNANGEWVENGEVTIGPQPPRKTFEMVAKPQQQR